MDKFFKRKKILITGHTGFKGSWLTQILLNWGADVTGLALAPNTDPNLFTILKLSGNVKNRTVDVRDFGKVKKVMAVEKPEIIFHLAAQPIVRESYDDPLYTYSTNVMGMANILQSIKETEGVRAVVLITTDKVYENKEWIYPYREIDRLGGHDPYSASKAAAEMIAASYMKTFFNVDSFGTKHSTLIAIARAGNVIGGGDWGEDRLVTDIIRGIYERNSSIRIRNPRAVRPWQHVLEPLSGYLSLARRLFENKKDFVGAWNLGPEISAFVTVREVVEKAIEIVGRGKVEIQKDNSKHEAHLLSLDTSKARAVLDWKPVLNFDKTIEYTFDWYKNYYEKCGDMINFTNNQIKAYFSLLK